MASASISRGLNVTNYSVKLEEAVALASALPALIRRLFTVDNDLPPIYRWLSCEFA